MTQRGIPEDSAVVIPRLFCRDAEAEIEFIRRTFEAPDPGGRPGPDGKVIHALLAIGRGMVMVEAEWPTLASRAPAPDGSSPVVVFVYVEDVDATVERALAAGAELLQPLTDQFWGDRTAWVMDPAGHVWTLASRIEATTEVERQTRWDTLLRDRGGE